MFALRSDVKLCGMRFKYATKIAERMYNAEWLMTNASPSQGQCHETQLPPGHGWKPRAPSGHSGPPPLCTRPSMAPKPPCTCHSILVGSGHYQTTRMTTSLTPQVELYALCLCDGTHTFGHLCSSELLSFCLSACCLLFPLSIPYKVHRLNPRRHAPTASTTPKPDPHWRARLPCKQSTRRRT